MLDAAPHPRRAHTIGGVRLSLLVLFALVTLAGAALALLAWNRPTTSVSVLTYRQTGKLSYQVPTGPASVYGSAGLVTGEPVYLKAVATLPFSYAYRIRASAPTHLQGTEQLVARVSNGHGIVRTVPLQPVTPFHGNAFRAAATLQVATVQSIAASFAAVAGSGQSLGTYTVSITPDVTVSGHVGPARLVTTFDAPVKFALSATALTPGAPAATPVRGTAATALPTGRPITADAAGSLRRASGQPTVLLAGLSVADARLASLVPLGVGLCAVAVLARPLLPQMAPRRERLALGARLGSAPVDVEAFPPSPGVTVVDVSSVDGLVRVARQLECPVLRRRTGAGTEYAVVDNGVIYRHGAGEPRAPVGPFDVGANAATIPSAPHNGATQGALP